MQNAEIKRLQKSSSLPSYYLQVLLWCFSGYGGENCRWYCIKQQGYALSVSVSAESLTNETSSIPGMKNNHRRVHHQDYDKTPIDTDILFSAAESSAEELCWRRDISRQAEDGLYAGAELLFLSRSDFVLPDRGNATVLCRGKAQYKPVCNRLLSISRRCFRAVYMRLCLPDGTHSGFVIQNENT